MRNLIRKYPITSYIVITFGYTSCLWISSQVVANLNDFQLYTMDSLGKLFNNGFFNSQHLFLFILFSLATYGPLLAAFIVTWAENGKDGLKTLFASMTNWKVNRKWYLLILLIPVSINLVAVTVGYLSAGMKGSWISPVYPIFTIIPFFIYQIFSSGLEEPGWRGFLLPKILKTKNPDKASWAVGLIWAIWHFPFVIPLYWSMGIAVLIPSLAGFTMAIIGQAFIFTWLYKNTESTFMAIIFHAILNTASIYMIGVTENPAVAILPALLTWVAVFIIMKKSDKQTFLLKNITN